MKFINALVVKLVDTKDLNPCQGASSSFRGTKINNEKIKIISDKNKSLKLTLNKRIKSKYYKKTNIIVIVDGFMLQT